MRRLLSYSLVAVGLLLVAKAAFIVVSAEASQPRAGVRWAEAHADDNHTPLTLPPGAVGRLRFRRLNRHVYVWGDEHPGNLAKGPVWLRQTRSFVSGGNTVIAGHRDTHFRLLKDARVGDIFEIQDDNARRAFRVSLIRIVRPTDRALLAPTAEKAVTLVTCYPFYMVGRANRRMIIRAELVDPQSGR
jgi:sortase A